MASSELHPNRVREAESSQVNAAAKKFILPERMVWLVVGDRAKIEAGIKELKLGGVVLLDAEGRRKSSSH